MWIATVCIIQITIYGEINTCLKIKQYSLIIIAETIFTKHNINTVSLSNQLKCEINWNQLKFEIAFAVKLICVFCTHWIYIVTGYLYLLCKKS